MFFKHRKPKTENKPNDMPPNPMEEAKRTETIRAILLPVGEPPVCITIPNSYETNKMLVNGPVSSNFIDLAKRDALLIMNDMAKLWGLPPNRYIFDGKDVLCGQAVIVGFDNETHRVCSMTDEQAERYKAMFAKPIVGKEAEVLNPIIEKHSKVTISDLSGENVQKFSLDDVRKGMGIEVGEKGTPVQDKPAGSGE